MTFKRQEMTFKTSEYLLIMNFDVSCQFPLICYITLQYKRFKKSPCVFRVMTFKTPEMTFRASEKNDTLFHFAQY